MVTKLFSTILAMIISITLSAQKRDISKPILNSGDVENFITNFKPLDAELEKLNVNHEAGQDFQDYIQGLEAKSEVNQVVQKYGYTNVSDFVSKALAISFSYLTIKIGSETSPELEKSLKQIDNDESLTPKQKEQAKEQRKQMTEALNSAFSSMVNPQDIETVKPFMSKLDVVFKEEEGEE